jgi:hypothetical protein
MFLAMVLGRLALAGVALLTLANLPRAFAQAVCSPCPGCGPTELILFADLGADKQRNMPSSVSMGV